MRVSCQNAKGIIIPSADLSRPARDRSHLAKLANPVIRSYGLAPLQPRLPMKFRPELAAALFTAVLLSGCYEVPVTGRHAMNLVDDKEVTKMSIAMFEDMKHQHKISRDKELN